MSEKNRVLHLSRVFFWGGGGGTAVLIMSQSLLPRLPPTNATLRMCNRVDDVMKLCCELSAHHQIRATVKGSSKGAVAAGGLAFAGGIVGGPLGIAVGQ